MNISHNKSWFIGLSALVVLLVAVNYTSTINPAPVEAQAIQFSELSNAELDTILAVKAEMLAADASSY